MQNPNKPKLCYLRSLKKYYLLESNYTHLNNLHQSDLKHFLTDNYRSSLIVLYNTKIKITDLIKFKIMYVHARSVRVICLPIAVHLKFETVHR